MSAIQSTRSREWAARRQRYFENKLGPQGPRDMRAVAQRMALDFPGTVKRRDN